MSRIAHPVSRMRSGRKIFQVPRAFVKKWAAPEIAAMNNIRAAVTSPAFGLGRGMPIAQKYVD